MNAYAPKARGATPDEETAANCPFGHGATPADAPTADAPASDTAERCPVDHSAGADNAAPDTARDGEPDEAASPTGCPFGFSAAPQPMPPKPEPRAERVTFWRYLKLFRQDMLSAQPGRLYRAWMAESRMFLFNSYMVNQPSLVAEVLKKRPDDFPKSDRLGEGLRPLLGNSVFLTNGETWKRQRRIIDPAFEGGRIKETFPAMWQAGEAAAARIARSANGEPLEVEAEMSHAAADVIFRTLFSIPIEHEVAYQVFEQFRDYQRSSPLLNIGAFFRLPKFIPRGHRRRTRQTAQAIRGLIRRLTEERMAEIEAGTAPDDLATKIMTTADPQTGEKFSTAEMVDQVAIFFLAGHETSASALSWTLYLMALYPEWQEKLANEAELLEACDFKVMSKLKLSRDIFREALRLYPPVPMMVRETTQPENFRDRVQKPGSQIVLSPWHLHRHERLWDNPDGFDPTRWKTKNGKERQRDAFIPFSAGSRVCTGAGFAMVEGPLLLSMLAKRFRFELVEGRTPVPIAHLTVRAKDGIWLRVTER